MRNTFEKLLNICSEGQINVRSDSREVKKGDIFIAVHGENENGAKYIPQAIAAGAAYIVCDEDTFEKLPEKSAPECEFITHEDSRDAMWRLAVSRWQTDKLPLTIIGVTGTNGKTTNTYILEKIFQASGHKTGVLGTVNYRWDGHCQAAPLTTPDALHIHSMLAQMHSSGVDVVILEVSSHALLQKRVNGLKFDGAVFTNLTQDHLDFHKDMEHYFQAKTKLFLELPKADKACAINSDDIYGRRLLDYLPDAMSYGLREENGNSLHLSGQILSCSVNGLQMRMDLDGKVWEIDSPLIGTFNAYNLLGAQAVALQCGVEPEVFSALNDFGGVCGRLERVVNSQGLHVFVDYAHTPDALIKAQKALREAGFKRIVTLFGCGGNRDRTKRPLMGEAVAEFADVAVLTSDNPRFEDPEAIIEDVKPGLTKAAHVVIDADRRNATKTALQMLGKEDALLIAGKGHENYQIIQGKKHHYSDQEVVLELLNCA